MDALRELMASADPMRHTGSPPARPALSKAINAPRPFTDAFGPALAEADRRRVPRGAAAASLLTAAAAAVVAGVLVTANGLGVAPDTGPATDPSIMPSLSPTVSPTAASPAPAAPKTFTGYSEGWTFSFDYPGDWTVAENPEKTADVGIDVSVVSADGRTIARLVAGSLESQALCTGTPRLTTLDSAPLDLPYSTQSAKQTNAVAPHFAYRTIEGPEVFASYGISTEVPPEGGTACVAYNEVMGPGSPSHLLGGYSFASDLRWLNTYGRLSFSSMDDARAFMETTEYSKAKAMIMSLRVAQK
jgi:hypothetical protein